MRSYCCRGYIEYTYNSFMIYYLSRLSLSLCMMISNLSLSRLYTIIHYYYTCANFIITLYKSKFQLKIPHTHVSGRVYIFSARVVCRKSESRVFFFTFGKTLFGEPSKDKSPLQRVPRRVVFHKFPRGANAACPPGHEKST